MSFEFKKRESLKKGLTRIAAEEADDAIARLKKRGGDRIETVHEVRKSIKKLRALLRLVRGAIGKKSYRLVNDALRDIGRQLSDARDAQILIEALEKLSATGSVEAKAAVAAIRKTLEAQRDGINAMLSAKGVFKSLVAKLEIAKENSRDWAGAAAGWADVESGLRDAYTRGRDAFETATRRPTFENFHDWRKRAKDLHYQVRMLQPLWPEALEKLSDDTGRLGELLGEDHDFGLLARLLKSGPARGVGARQSGLRKAIERRGAELRGEARKLGETVYADKPRAFIRRIAALWDAW